MRALSLLVLSCSALLARAQPPCDVHLVTTPLDCPGDQNATITVVADTPGQYTYSWLQIPSLTGPTATGLPAGSYTVTVTDTSGCVSVLDTVIATPVVAPLGTITTTNISCAGMNDGSVTFTINPGPYTWQWVDAPTNTNTTRTDLGPGTYVVVVYGGPCPSYIFSYLGDPDMNTVGDTAYCPSNPPTLTANMNWGFQPDVYLWSTGETTSSITIPAGMTGPVTVAATDTGIGCTVTDSINLTLLPHPTVAFNPPDTLCINTEAQVFPSLSTADSLVWHWGADSVRSGNSVVVSFSEPGWQPISLQGFDSLGCGSAPLADSIYSRPRIPAIFTAEQIPCSPSIQVELGSTSDSCAFYVGNQLMLSACSGFYELDLQQYANYAITFISTQPGLCNDTAFSTIDVRTVPTLFLPTAFTPNNDGINDTWPGPVDIPPDGFEVMVFNRWGEILWTSRDTQAKWDGAGLPDGVYGYKMRMRDPCNTKDEIVRDGIITLFR